ncbi:hypothetical protein [Streptomyces violascens]|uniref:hypothetical protein n=1 Tax=Streptomyces violascens TaxID=67381 RepID=UPI00367B654F
MSAFISGQGADSADALFQHSVTTDPQPLSAGVSGTKVCVQLTPSTGGVYCSRVTVDLQAPGLNAICSNLTGAEIEIVTCPDGPPWIAEIDGSKFSLHYENDYGDPDVCAFAAGDSVAFNVINLTPDTTTGDTGVRTTEHSGTNSQLSDATDKSTDHHLTRTSPGTVFRDFGPLDPKRVLIARDEMVTLTWEAAVPDYHRGRADDPYYTLTLTYNGQTFDVTTSIDPTSGDGVYTTEPLGSTTLFTLTLALFGPNQISQGTYTQQAFIVASPTDLIVNNLTVDGPTLILNPRTTDVIPGQLLASTDGFLHCHLTGDGSNPSALQITSGNQPSYTISTSTSDTAKFLLPIPKDTYVTIEQPQGKSNGTYTCTWHPLGTGSLSYTQVFTTSDTGSDGNVTWTVPKNTIQAIIELWGPGGEGVAIGSGGAGAYLKDTLPVTPGEQLTFHIGKTNDHTRILDAKGNLLLLAAGGGHSGGPVLAPDLAGGAGGAGYGYTRQGMPNVRGGSAGGSSNHGNATGGYNVTGGYGDGPIDRTAYGAGGNGWDTSGADGEYHTNIGGGGAGPGTGKGGNGTQCTSAGGGGKSGGASPYFSNFRGGGTAGGQGSGGGGAGGNGYGDSGAHPWGANGAGGGGGSASSPGGGGSQGWSYLRDPGVNGTFYDGGVTTQPAGKPPAGIATGGTGTQGGDYAPGGDGAVRVTWAPEPASEDLLARRARHAPSA